MAGLPESMSLTGKCEDDAVTASFFGRLLGEGVERTCFQTCREARQTIVEEVECFYHLLQRHSSLGSVSPVADEQVRCSLEGFRFPQKRVNLSCKCDCWMAAKFDNYLA